MRRTWWRLRVNAHFWRCSHCRKCVDRMSLDVALMFLCAQGMKVVRGLREACGLSTPSFPEFVERARQ